MMNPTDQPTQAEERRRKNVLTISLTTGILFVFVAAVSGYVGYTDNGVRGLVGLGITGAVAIMAFISAYLSRSGRPNLGISILIGMIFAISFTIPFVVHGQALALGIMIAIVVAGISSATLPPVWATRVIISAFTAAVIITVMDLFLPDFGLPTNPAATNLIAAVTSTIYVIFILRRFNSYAFRTKIIIAFTLVTIIPLVALGIFNSRSSSQSLQNQNKTQLTTLAKVVADNVDGFMTTQLDAIRADSKQLPLSSFLDLPPQSRAGSIEENNAQLVLLSLLRKDPIFIHSIAVLNEHGINMLDTFEEYNGQDESAQAYFKRPTQTGLPYASNVVFRDADGFIYFSSPITGKNGEVVGVLRIEYYATVIQSIVRSIETESSGTIILLADSRTYLRVGYTGDRDELLKSFNNFNNLEFSVMQLEGRLLSGPRESALQGINDVIVAGMDNLQREPFFEAYSDSLGSNTINTGVFLNTQPWIAIIRQSTNVYLKPVSEQNRTNILISMGLIILSIGAGFLASQILTSPIISLAKVAEQITAGDLTARAGTTTEDEIGALADSFNRMTEELNQTVNSLELRVSERTTDLEISREQSEDRANKLQAIGEISRIIASEQKLEILFPLITRLVSERFGYYHSGIFLINETKQFAVLQAANSKGGKNMLARGHRLEVGASGIVGFVAQHGTPRIALDVGLDAVYFNNPDLPTTRSEMALPLKFRDEVVGVLDVQSEQSGAFTENDADTLSILADQIAIALENARLFAQTQQALDEAQALYQQNVQEGWLTFSREEDTIGYHQGMGSGRKLKAPIETEAIRQVMNRGTMLVTNADGESGEPSMIVPIKLRGRVIGAMNIKAPASDRQWSGDEINLVEAISARLSLALENARLIQESQRQAIKEQTIGEVTGKIGASINMKNVLQTAVEELGKAMPGSEIVIKFQNGNSQSEK
ncbi:MAG: GAF domain-containing protein [Chloroflexi bacterium]|nr:GAF domain-containing protein [Chloroflexota bacterium]